MHTQYKEGEYSISLKVTSEYGCLDSISKNFVIQSLISIYIPNAFTPNNDDYNDYFKIFATNIKELSIYIFDRWGDVVFYTNNFNIPWNGKSMKTNEPLPQGVYAYKILTKDIYDNENMYNGYISLLK
jgi:gliding motility-associated-like protein